MSAVAFIVGNMHVGTSLKEVVREFYRRFKEYSPDTPKRTRKKIYKEAIRCHKVNRREYNYVMGGGHGYPFSRRK